MSNLRVPDGAYPDLEGEVYGRKAEENGARTLQVDAADRPLQAVIKAAGIIIHYERLEGGFAGAVIPLTLQLPIGDDAGQVRPGIDLRGELYRLVDAAVDRVEAVQQGEE